MPETPENLGQPDILIQNLQKPVSMFGLGALAVAILWYFTSSSGTITVNDVSIDYTYHLSENRTSRSAMDADSIVFQPGFILIRHDNGSGQLLAVDRIQEFHFQPVGQ